MLDLHRLRLLREVNARGTVHGAARALGYTAERHLPTARRCSSARPAPRCSSGSVATSGSPTPDTCWSGHADALLDGVEAAEAELADVAAGKVAGVVRVSAFQSAFLRIVAPTVRDLGATPARASGSKAARPRSRRRCPHCGCSTSTW